jgi:hypothetical protein
MSDEQVQSLIRAYNADPADIRGAARLISVLLRERNGEDAGESSKAIAFFISCSTGCTCCSNENFIDGPFRSLKRARETAQSYHDSKRLASQYASNGRYELGWSEVEILPDGRIVADDRIFGGFGDDPDYDGWNDDISSDDFYPDSYNIDDPSKRSKMVPDWYVDPEAAI